MQGEPKTPLEAARRDKGIPRYKAAFLVGVTDKTLSTWESGDRSPSLDEAKVLAEIYGVDPNRLAGWKSAGDGASAHALPHIPF